MLKLLKVMCLAGLVSMLTACEDRYNYQYLITHPAIMKKEMDACDVMGMTASNVEKERCAIVTHANATFMGVVVEQKINAEKFGVRVLTAETDYANARIKVKQLEADLANAKTNSGDTTSMHKLEEDLAAAIKDCEDKRQEVRMLLAVMGVSTPN